VEAAAFRNRQAPQPRELANALLLLVEGAYAVSQTLGGGADGAGHSIVWASDVLVDAQVGNGGKAEGAIRRDARS
jgi:hypothetical protein